MTVHSRSAANPDGFGPIDAVVTWVDGGDPGFMTRRRRAVERLKRSDPLLARRSELRFAPARYIQHDEIRYCIRSIFNHAPWIRRIWLVTDDQFPSVFNRDLLDEKIVVVSHRDLFRSIPDALPVFNSGAIEVMLSEIEGISDRFICFNDDFFLSMPVGPEHFFDGMTPVIRGRWVSLGPSEPAWLQRRIRSAELFGYSADHVFREGHSPYSLNRQLIGRMFDDHPGLRYGMARRKFRSAEDYYIVSMHHHYCLSRSIAVIDDKSKWLLFADFPMTKDEQEIRKTLTRIKRGRHLSICFNVLGDWVENFPEIYDYLEAGTGPRLAFER